jgi:hypothetical protein
MSKKLTTKSFNNRIVILLVILSLSVIWLSGCSMSVSTGNGNNTANANSVANKTTVNSNANSNTTANSNTNANTSASPTNTAANTATAAKEEKPLTAEEQEFKDTLVGEWKNDKMTITFTETEFSSKLNDGTVNAGPYHIVDEHNIEATLTRNNAKFKATMSFEDNGKILNWKDPSGTYKYTRVK